ncbi:MAG TPA: hypothetical protein VHQ42_01595 [Candidatus Limnocylindria bacterium]|nr:hypothetical protein [Candidatus Limnocylindria bacterium]
MTIHLTPMRLPVLLAVASLLAGLLMAAPARAHDPVLGVDPASVELTLVPGASEDVTKTVHTPQVLPTPDIYFLADSTGSMFGTIATVQANAAAVLAAVDLAANDPRYGAGDYKDFPFDPYAFANGASIPASDDGGAAALAAIMGWSATGGGDGPEAQLYALHRLAQHGDAAFRAAATPIVVWFGDAPGHDPVCDEISGDTGHDLTEASVTTELMAAGIRVIAISVLSGYPAGLDDDPTLGGGGYLATCGIENGASGQATRIAAATGGIHLTGVAPGDIADAILAGLTALPVEVTPSATCDDPGVTVSWDAPSRIVTSGEDATFTETITVGAGAPQGETVICTADFLVDGELLDGFTQTITVHIPDVTAPLPACDEGTNPHGATVPRATNQNPDGFYLLTAVDNVDPDPAIWVVDSGSGRVFGPYASGTTIKYVEAPGATPSEKTMGSTNGAAGAVTVKITGTGDALVYAIDASGNVSDPVSCLVPPPPR